jgi:hypothetical protein
VIHQGERERLAEERRELLHELAGLPRHSRLRPGLEHRLVKITTRLMLFGRAVDVVMPERADLA